VELLACAECIRGNFRHRMGGQHEVIVTEVFEEKGTLSNAPDETGSQLLALLFRDRRERSDSGYSLDNLWVSVGNHLEERR